MAIADSETPANNEQSVEIRSPYRPLPRSARKELSDAVEIIDELDGDKAGRNEGVIVDERPPESILEQYELTVVREPEIVYLNSRHDERVEIYTEPSKVVADGSESKTLSVVEAVQKSEDHDGLTRIKGSPELIDGVDVDDVATDAPLPVDPEEIPDRWEIELHPRRGDQRVMLLIARPSDSDTEIQATIMLTTPTSRTVDREKFSVIVHDQDAEADDGHSLPLAERVHYDEMEQAVDRLRECVEEYPLGE